jgi:BTB/POZ domain-containing protein KCTD9
VVKERGYCMIDLGEISFYGANLKRINLERALLETANFFMANLEESSFGGAILDETNLEGANLTEAFNLSIDQLSKVRTLYNAKIDEELLIQLKEEFSSLFKSLKQKFLEYQSNLLGANAHNNL